MVRVEVSQASLPVQYILFAGLKSQADLVGGIYDGMEVHLTRGKVTRQLVRGEVGDGSVVTGLHQSARTERLGGDFKEWPKSLFAWAFWLVMRHRMDSLPQLNLIAHNVGQPDIPTVLYPSRKAVELQMVASNCKLFQPKIEVARMYGVDEVSDWRRVLGEEGRWAGLCYDTQHSSRIIPKGEFAGMRDLVKRVHVSVGRTDIESADTRIPLSPLFVGKKDEVLYPMLAELADQPDGIAPMVVESGRMAIMEPKKWRAVHSQIAGTLRKWME